MAQKVGVWAPRLEQLRWNRVHSGKPVVADDDVQVVVGVNERAGHVVQSDLELRFLVCNSLFCLLARSDVRIGKNQSGIRHWSVLDVECLPRRQRIFK